MYRDYLSISQDNFSLYSNQSTRIYFYEFNFSLATGASYKCFFQRSFNF